MTRGAQLLRRAASLLAVADGPGAEAAATLVAEIEEHLRESGHRGTRRITLSPRETLTPQDRERIEIWNQAALHFPLEVDR